MPEMEMRETDVSTAGGNEDLRVELERSAESSNHLPTRERKAGCKNFYWKGFTSCWGPHLKWPINTFLNLLLS